MPPFRLRRKGGTTKSKRSTLPQAAPPRWGGCPDAAKPSLCAKKPTLVPVHILGGELLSSAIILLLGARASRPPSRTCKHAAELPGVPVPSTVNRYLHLKAPFPPCGGGGNDHVIRVHDTDTDMNMWKSHIETVSCQNYEREPSPVACW